ncbi:serine kinase [Dyella psychrodurans]|uniref:Serine kinase n=1 Tax=Dyella psychrodurans TaxID=1927960 RepID=A0A370X0Y7_9GAMM|nr:serine kinase [Dyella psychrodurans]RDS81931.1 serine kinase [Dyella psychrodurans]
MALTCSPRISETHVDPFRERSRQPFSTRKQILGGSFLFESNSVALLHVVDQAYGGLPSHHLPTSATSFRIELRLLPRNAPSTAEPPPVQMQSGAGILCGIMDACNYVVLMPEQHKALVVASEDMLQRPYHLRYELIEFAVFTLASRGVGLVPLHAACVGLDGRGVLLLGASGSGKSTLALHSLLRGLDFLAEDAVFVQPENMLATGVANYLHMQADALRFVEDESARRWISESPVIRRRSGAAKFEADLRLGYGRPATAPLKLVGAVFVSSQAADDASELLHPLPEHDIAGRLVADQPYAAGQPGWSRFEEQLRHAGVYRLRRGSHPRASVDALLQLLGK